MTPASTSAATQDYIDFKQASMLMPSQPHPGTIWRWARSGIRLPGGDRLTLPYIRSGHRILTTSQWLEDFLREWYDAEEADVPTMIDSDSGSLPLDLDIEYELQQVGL